MAVESITFPAGDMINKANGQGTTTLTGTLTVDYTAMTVTGTLTDGQGYTYTGFNYTITGGNYVLSSPQPILGYGLSISYPTTVAPPANAQAPTSVATSSTFTTAGGVLLPAATTSSVAVTSAAVCYVSGTLIRTARGDVAVEHLAVGDLAVTASGQHRPIRWIGHQTHSRTGKPQPRSIWPVRVAAHAFGDDKPSADLYLSPGHSVCLSVVTDVLVPVQELVNGSTIAYAEVDEVTYWHVELDSHDLLVANNMPAESYLEMGANRAVFAEGRGLGDPSAEAVARTHADFCRPFVGSGPILGVLRNQLERRAAELGWQPRRSATVAATVDGHAFAPFVRGGEAIFALPPAVGDIRVSSSMTMPALLGCTDPRLIGLAVYAIELMGANGEVRRLDLDAPDLAPCFHSGERNEGLHYRYTSGDIVLPAAAAADLAAPIMLRLAYEPSTLRGWSAPETLRDRPMLRIAA